MAGKDEGGPRKMTTFQAPAIKFTTASLQEVEAARFKLVKTTADLMKKADVIDERLILWTDSEKVTPFSPYCTEQMTLVETVHKHSTTLVDKIRCCAQPNSKYRGERLVPSDVNAVSERLQFVTALRDAITCFDNMKPLSEHARKLAGVQEEVERLHDTFLRRVVLFGVKPIKKYLDEVYPTIKKSYADLTKCRDKYDGMRAKMPKSASDAEVAAKTKTIRTEFADKANALGALFKEMPTHQMSLSKAVDVFARSERDFCAETAKVIDSLSPFSASQFDPTAMGGGPGGQLILWTDSKKVTPFSPYCIEQMTRVETVHKHSTKLVDKIRCCAQPNPLYRGERLVPSDVNAVSERLQFVTALRDATICFDNMKPLSEYAQELAGVQEEVERLHDTYLRKITLFGVKPFKKYLDEVYPTIKKSYADLTKCRDKYDAMRAKMAKSASDPEVVAKTKTIQTEFADKANALGALFKEMPMHQVSLLNAVDDCARSECDFCAQAIKLIDSVNPPDDKRRWEFGNT